MPISGGGSGSGLTAISDKHLLANTSGASAVPIDTALSTLLDSALGNAQGDILYRGASGWAALAPGTSGNFLQTAGASANPAWAAGNAGTVTSVSGNNGLTGTVTGSGNIGLAAIADGDVLANTSGSSAVPVATTVSAVIDHALGSTRGAVLYRGASGWAILVPGASGSVLTSNGSGADPSYGAIPQVSSGWNPTDMGGMMHLYNSNRDIGSTSTGQWTYSSARAKTGYLTGKHYCELLVVYRNGNTNGIYFGLSTGAANINSQGSQAGSWTSSYAAGCGTFTSNTGTGSITSGAAFAYTVGDVVGLAFDGDGHTLSLYKNNSLQITWSSLEATTFYPVISCYDAGSLARLSTFSSQFTYTPPSGYSAWES